MPVEQEILSFGIDVDVQAATRKVAGFQKELDRYFKKVAKSVEGMGKASDKVNKKSARGVDDLVEAYEQETKTISNLSLILTTLGRKAEKAGGTELKNLQRQIKETKKLFGARKAAAKASGAGADAKAAKEKQKQDKAGAKKLKGIFETMFEGTSIGRKAKSQREKGRDLRKRGKALGKGGAAMGGAKGGAVKGIGKAMGGIGKLVGVFSKIVPVLGMAATAIMAIVKLFLDADAHVKEFNKSILQTAGTSDFVGSSAKGLTGDFNKLNKTLTEMRNTAEEFWFNNDWGIMPEDHVKVLNIFNQEGVSLRAMGVEAEKAYGSVKKYQQELMAVSVAYSRAFGIPMQTINQFQAEMFTEMGMSLGDTKLAFAQMTRAAADSGIASNKFFSMIRGVSQDLSLYNMRLGSAVKLLGLLGKVMNPRDAQKFMQFAMQGLKGMSQDDRMQLIMLAGGKGKGIIEKDLKNRQKNLTKSIAEALGKTSKSELAEIEKTVAAGGAQGLIKQIDPSKAGLGAMRGAAIDLKLDTTAKEKGAYGQAFAAENMGAGGALELMQAAIGKGGSLSAQAGDLGMTKMAEARGISTGQLRGFMKLEMAIIGEKEAMIEKLEETSDYQRATEKEQAKMVADIQAKGAQDIIDAMSPEDQAALKDAAASEMDLMKEQTGLQDSILDQIKRLIDFLMNQLYSVLNSILDMFIGLSKKMNWFGGGAAGATEEVRREEQKFKGMEEGPLKDALKKAWSESAGQGAEDRLEDYKKKEKEIYAAKQEKDTTTALKEKVVGAGVGPMGPEQTAVLDRLAKVLDPDKLREALFAKGGEKAVEALGEKELTPENIREALIEGGVDTMAADKESRGVYAEAMANDPEALASMKVWEAGKAADKIPLEPGFKRVGDPRHKKVQEDSDKALMDKVAQKKQAGMPGGWVGTTDPNQNWVEQAPGDAPGEGGGFNMEEDAAKQEDIADATLKTAEAVPKVAAAIIDQTKNQKRDGTVYVRFSKSFLTGDYKTVVAEAMLDSMRLALFEYFMYSKLDPKEVAEMLSNQGMSGPEMAKALGEGAPGGDTAKSLFGVSGGDDDDDEAETDKKEREKREKKKQEKQKPKPKTSGRQHGGMVKSIGRGGLAEFEPRSGEGFASVGPGETISPAYGRGRGGGGGTQHVVISLRGDAKRMFQAMITDGIYENKRRERNA